MALIRVRHNIEVAHRLFEAIPGDKCEQIHGHSMWVNLTLYGGVNEKGILETDIGPLDFGTVKQYFRKHLDENYDHHLLLNDNDPWADSMFTKEGQRVGELPGLHTVPGDPTTEHLSLWIARWASETFGADASVIVNETHVNAAGADWAYGDQGDDLTDGVTVTRGGVEHPVHLKYMTEEEKKTMGFDPHDAIRKEKAHE